MTPPKKRLFSSPNWKLGIFWSGNIKTAIASLRRNRWRSFFTMLGVIIGVTLVVTVVSLGEGLKHQIAGQINQLGSDVITVRPGKLVNRNTKGSINSVNLLAFFNTSTLDDLDISALKAVDSVKSVVPIDFLTNSAKGDNGSSNNLVIVGTSPEMADVLNLKLDFGTFFTTADSQNFAVIGQSAAKQLFGTRDPFAHSVSISGSEFIIHGILAPSSGGLLSVGQTDFNSTIFIPYAAAKKLTGDRTNILQILIKVKPDANLDNAVADIHQALVQNHHGQEDFTLLKQYELLAVSSNVVNRLTGFISAIAAISLLVGGIGIMDIMLVAVTERTREIGVRKAIGATNRQILNQFLTEGLVLSVGGGIFGLVVALFINLMMRLYTDLHPVITLPIILLALGVSIAVGVVFSGVPALQAARKQPIDALRGE